MDLRVLSLLLLGSMGFFVAKAQNSGEFCSVGQNWQTFLCPEDACILCNYCDFSGFTGQTVNTPNLCVCPDNFCGTIENAQWVAFLAPKNGHVRFWFSVGNCVNGKGIQAAVVEKTGPLPEDYVVFNNACVSPGVETNFGLDAWGLEPYCVYYLLIDGFAGDVCGFTVTIDQCEFESPKLTIQGPNVVCLEDHSKFTIGGISTECNEYGAAFTFTGWEQHGSLLHESENDVVIKWHTPGTVTLEASTYLPCNGQLTTLPFEIEIKPPDTTYIYDTLMIGCCVEIGGIIYENPGVYWQHHISSLGCDSIVNIYLDAKPPIIVTDTIPCDGFLIVRGDTLFNPSIGIYTEYYPSSSGCCDSVVYSFIAPNPNIDIFAKAISPISCSNIDSTVLSATVVHTSGAYKLQWTTTDGHIVSGDTTLHPVIDEFGRYCLRALDLSSGCAVLSCVDVKLSDLAEVSLPPLVLDCGQSQGMLEASIDPKGTPITIWWTTDDGTILSGDSTSAVQIDGVGTYCIHVAQGADCQQVHCVDVKYDVAVEIMGPGEVCANSSAPYAFQVKVSGLSSDYTLYYQLLDSMLQSVQLSATDTVYSWLQSISDDSRIDAWVVAEDGCFSDTFSLIIEVADPTVHIEVEQPGCSSTTLTAKYSAQAQSYLWSTGDTTMSIQVTDAGEYAVTVTGTDGCADADTIVFVPDFPLNCAHILGQVLIDTTGSCVNPNGQIGLANWLVTAASGMDTFNVFTGADGSFDLAVPPGSYVVKVTPIDTTWAICQNALSVTLLDFGDTTSIQFYASLQNLCPKLWVKSWVGLMRRCQPVPAKINYCNHGNIEAENVSIELKVDTLLELIGASVPFDDLGGGIYRFQLGNLAAGDCGAIQLEIFVDCMAPLGKILCVDAVMHSDNDCPTQSAPWSGASLEIVAGCDEQDGEVYFDIHNTGSAATTRPITFRIYRDGVINGLGGTLMLTPGSTIRHTVPADGSTWTMRLQQEPYHPDNTEVFATVEQCGSGIGGVVSYGFSDDFPSTGTPPYSDLVCRPVLGSYDPNLKTAIPEGYGSDRFVPRGTELEYMVTFQNEGNDTAFQVVIRDTLSSHFELSSLSMGISSHPFSWQLLGNRVLKLTFDDIKLPPASIDEANSQGYFKFRIRLRDDLLPGTVVSNRAAIYFDHNLPIITPPATHTIEKPVVMDYQQVTLCSGDMWSGSQWWQDTLVVQIRSFPAFDSIHLYDLRVLQSYEQIIPQTLCAGDTLEFMGEMLWQTGAYEFPLETVHGCDSNVIVQLEVLEPYHTFVTDVLCAGDTYQFAGQTLSEPGTYQATLTSHQGCDSLVELSLAVLPVLHTSLEASICEGEVYEFNGMLLDQAGTYQATLTSHQGCDSLVELSLEVLPPVSGVMEASICEGEELAIGDTILAEAGTHTLKLLSSTGCDSILTVHLAVEATYDTTIFLELHPGDIYQGVPLYNDTTLIEHYLSEEGCDSTVTVLVDIVSATKETAAILTFTVVPNPAHTLLEIRATTTHPVAANLVVFDAFGRRMFVSAPNYSIVQEHRFRLQVESWPEGVYLIDLRTPLGRAVKAVVIQH